MGKLLLLFTVVPFVDLYLLLRLADRLGGLETLALVLGTGILGAWMARREGFRVIRSWQTSLEQGRVPPDGVMGGVLVLVGGVLLVTPGVLTDAVGFCLLWPPTRRFVARRITGRIERGIREGNIHVTATSFRRGGLAGPVHPFRGGDPGVIDVEAEVRDVEADSAEG